MKLIKKNWHKLILLFFIPFSMLYAAVEPPIVGVTLKNPIEADSIQEFIQTILTGALRVGIPVIALAIVYSGFLFVFARGNSEKLGKAKSALLYTLIGAAILLGSWAIAEMISTTVAGL